MESASNKFSGVTLGLASKAALENAKKLITDAKILLLFRRHWHAYALLILADEEIAKAYLYDMSKYDSDLLNRHRDVYPAIRERHVAPPLPDSVKTKFIAQDFDQMLAVDRR